MRRLLAILLSLTAGRVLVAGPMLEGEETRAPHVSEAREDGQGMIWTIDESSARNEIQAFDGKNWRTVRMPFPPGPPATPQELTVRSDGSVVCVWSMGRDKMALSRHLGSQSDILAPLIPAEITPNRWAPALFADSREGIWIMAGERRLYRVPADGKAELVMEMTDSERVKSLERVRKTNPFAMAEDGRGRLWAWTRRDASNYDSLRGIYIFDGTNAHRQADFSGIKGDYFTEIIPRDAKSMWMAAQGDGLYAVDIESFTATPVAALDEGAFRNISKLYQQGGDLFAVCGLDAKRALWRQHAGKWEQLIAFYECDPRSRFWLPVDHSLIVGGTPSPWYIPPGKPAVQLNWQNGFPMTGVIQMLRFKDGALFAANGAFVVVEKELKLPPKAGAPSRVTELLARSGLIVDMRGHVWYLPKDRRNLLEEWDGGQWSSHEIPGSIDPMTNLDLVADDRGRIWLMPRSDHTAMALLDTSTGKWSEFPEAADAFQSVLDAPPRFLDGLNFPPGAGTFRPIYSGRHIAYVTGYPRLAYFDGEKWQQWAVRDILVQAASGKLEQPAFDADGRLMVTIGPSSLRWNGTGFEDNPNPPPPKLPPAQNYVLLPDGTRADGSTAVQDNQGVYWLLRLRQLQRAVPGKVANVFAEGEANPFGSARMLNHAYVAANGTAFLEVENGGFRYFMIAPKSAPPRVSLASEAPAADSIVVKVKSESQGEIQARWRLDDEPWRPLVGQSVALDFLPPGPHVFQVEASDRELQVAEPVAANFTVEIDPQAQIQGMIKRLNDPDFTRREAAIVALKRQPAAAMKELKAARNLANEDQRWWIDAALQEIESAPARK